MSFIVIGAVGIGLNDFAFHQKSSRSFSVRIRMTKVSASSSAARRRANTSFASIGSLLAKVRHSADG
jgi:hypothetical protein